MRKTIISIGFIIFFGTATAVAGEDTAEQIRHLLEKETIQRADAALHEEPVTVTATRATRSAGGIHDFYSEGDYWWPNPEAPDGPYIRRDGETNPENFTAHRQAMIRMSQLVGDLTSAWILTGNQPGHTDESQSAVSTGHQGSSNRTRDRNHRYDSPDRSSAVAPPYGSERDD